MTRVTEAGAARSPGAVWTPATLARRLVRPLLPEITAARPVLDPACGEGALLLACFEGLRERLGRMGALCALRGIELDPERAHTCRRKLLAAAELPAESSVGRAVAKSLAHQIVCADALDPAVPWPSGATFVVANPPWVSFSGRQALALAADRRRLYREHWAAFGGWPSLHGAFLERIALHLARERGRARVLVPAAVCDQERYGPTRVAVQRQAALEQPPSELGEAAFPGVTEPAVLLSLAGQPEEARRGTAMNWLRDSATAAALAELVARPRLPDKTFADPGVHTGNASRELVVRSLPGSPPPTEGAHVPVREGRNLFPFDMRAPSAWLRVDLERTATRRFRIAPLARLRGFPILLRQTADRPKAALHSEPEAFRNSLLACREVGGLEPAFVVAILNSTVACAWHRAMFLDARQRTFPQIKVGHLATQPMPIAGREQDPSLHDEVVRRVLDLRPDRADFAERVRDLNRLVERAFALSPRATAVVRELTR